jgi:hypothetical protein
MYLLCKGDYMNDIIKNIIITLIDLYKQFGNPEPDIIKKQIKVYTSAKFLSVDDENELLKQLEG